jgi:hypothetical protein
MNPLPDFASCDYITSMRTDTEQKQRRKRVTVLQRFVAKHIDHPDECWIWPHALSESGYGRAFVSMDRRLVTVHRYLYEEMVGPIPDGLQLDHLCRNRACANPSHVEPVTSRENTMRGETPAAHNARKTHCPLGHPLSGDNLRINYHGRGKTGTPFRSCKECARESVRRRRARLRAAA